MSQFAGSFLLTTLNAKYIHLNLAIRLLYDLNCEDSRLHWKEFTIKEDPNTVARFCAQFDVVCFSCYIWNIEQTKVVCEQIKQINPNIKILLGGPEVSYEWQDIIALTYIDYIITGEGEIPFQQFLQQFPIVTAVPNLVCKTADAVHYQPAQIQFDVTLYEGRNPYRHDDPSTLQHRVLYIETSRGCPYKCAFCLASLDNNVRYLPMSHIFSNLDYLMQYGKTIKFLDRTFNVKKDFTIQIFDYIRTRCKPGFHIFQFEITADILHRDIMQYVKTNIPYGVFRFEIGIQTVNQTSNLAVQRKQNFEKTKSVILDMQSFVDMHLDLIVGLPFDYWDDIKNSIETVFALYPPELQLGFLKFLKGTPVRENYAAHGYQFEKTAPYEIIESKYLNQHELQQIRLVEMALEIYWNKKRAKQLLRWIAAEDSIFDFLLELGRCWYSQKSNQPTLKEMYEIIHTTVNTYTFKNPEMKKMAIQLLAIDYYTQFVICPGDLILPTLPKKMRNEILMAHSINIHNDRYVVLPIDFSWNDWLHNHTLPSAKRNLIIRYDGIHKPQVTEIA